MKVRTALLCEMCRPELGNKWALLGVISGDVFFPSFPAQFALSAYFEIEGLEAGAHHMTVSIVVPGSTLGIEAEFEIVAGSPVATLPLPNATVAVNEPGDLTITLSIDHAPPAEVVTRKLILGG